MIESEKWKEMGLLVEEGLQDLLENLGEKSVLKDAISYSINNGGKRLRPILILLLGEALGNKQNLLYSALAVECLHTASLIADDLPCMDNEQQRRGLACVHLVYPKSVAILASFTLISLGYEYMHKNAISLDSPLEVKNSLGMQVLATVAEQGGVFGATGGQFLDLFAPDEKRSTLENIVEKKTGSLFIISFVAGWLFGGGDPEKLEKVKIAASHFGRAFQLRDDILDLEEDNAQKNTSNLAAVLGKQAAIAQLQNDLKAFRCLLTELCIATDSLHSIANALDLQEKSVSTNV